MLMLCRIQHILLSFRSACVLDNQINVSESSDWPESGKNNIIPLSWHRPEIQKYIYGKT